MKKQPKRRMVSNQPFRQNVRKIGRKGLIKPYGMNGRAKVTPIVLS